MSEDVRDERSARHTVVRVGWAAYQQVAAVFGAFSMAVFAGEVFGLGWRGILDRLVGVWDQFVRPPVKWVVDAITWPCEWAFDWRIEVPLLIRDYLAVGLVYWLASPAGRDARRYERRADGGTEAVAQSGRAVPV